MVIVACIHMNQWHSIKRSSWGTGAGFGMFATVDYHGSRFIHCIADTAQGPVELDVPKAIYKQSGLVARTIPSKENLLYLAKVLYEQDWYLDVDQNGNRFGNTLPADSISLKPIVVRALELKIGGMRIDSENKKLLTHTLNSVEYRPNEESSSQANVQSASCEKPTLDSKGRRDR